MLTDFKQRFTGSKFLCLDCGAVYNSVNLNIDARITEDNPYGDVVCPKANCEGELIEVDELLIPTIWILNQKGYMTEDSCSGHYTSDRCRTYIKFECGIDVLTVPRGFTKKKYGDNVTIESYVSFRKPDLNDFYKICDNAKELARWAESLPDIDDTKNMRWPY